MMMKTQRPKTQGAQSSSALAPFVLLTFMAFALDAQAATKPGANQDPGRLLADEACSTCHQVAPGQTVRAPVDTPDEGPKVRAPSFVEIAKRCEPADNLRAKITSPHYPMRNLVLTPLDVDSLARYIRTLAPGTACPVH